MAVILLYPPNMVINKDSIPEYYILHARLTVSLLVSENGKELNIPMIGLSACNDPCRTPTNIRMTWDELDILIKDLQVIQKERPIVEIAGSIKFQRKKYA